jgi:ParB family transcriptional regulator, chromosome partitioning protein
MKKSLEALIPKPRTNSAGGVFSSGGNESIFDVHLGRIKENPWQPRIEIDSSELQELAATIEEHGLLQPIVLRKHDGDFQIVAGHRRVAAHKLLGKETVKAIVRDVSDSQMKILVAVENLQRKNLEVIEVAIYLHSLLSEGEMTQKELADKLGLTESYVSRHLGLLNLSAEVIEMIKQKIYTNLKVLNAISKAKESSQVTFVEYIVEHKLSTTEAMTYLEQQKENKEKHDYTVLKNEFAVVSKRKDRYTIDLDSKKLSVEQKDMLETFIDSLK